MLDCFESANSELGVHILLIVNVLRALEIFSQRDETVGEYLFFSPGFFFCPFYSPSCVPDLLADLRQCIPSSIQG